MRNRKLSGGLRAVLAILIPILIATAARAGAQQETVLHNFPSTKQDGDDPQAAVVFDAVGNIYGTTTYGGPGACAITIGCGTVFELTPAAGSGWTEKILHAFGYGTDGSNPYGPLVFDAQGNLYGTTIGGGTGAEGPYLSCRPPQTEPGPRRSFTISATMAPTELVPQPASLLTLPAIFTEQPLTGDCTAMA